MSRNVNRVALTWALAAAFAEQDGNELSLRLIRAGVPAGPVLPVDQSTGAPHTEHREMVTELDWYKGIGTPIKFSRTKGGTAARRRNSREHGSEVLVQHGYSEAEIEGAETAGVLYDSGRYTTARVPGWSAVSDDPEARPAGQQSEHDQKRGDIRSRGFVQYGRKTFLYRCISIAVHLTADVLSQSSLLKKSVSRRPTSPTNFKLRGQHRPAYLTISSVRH